MMNFNESISDLPVSVAKVKTAGFADCPVNLQAERTVDGVTFVARRQDLPLRALKPRLLFVSL